MCGDYSIDHPVIGGKRHGHDRSDDRAVLVVRNDSPGCAPNSQNRGLERMDDSGETVYAEHAKVREVDVWRLLAALLHPGGDRQPHARQWDRPGRTGSGFSINSIPVYSNSENSL